MKCFPAINFMNYFLLIILTEHLIANINPIAEVKEIKGEINLTPTTMDRLPGPAIKGRSMYNGDIIHVTQNSEFH